MVIIITLYDDEAILGDRAQANSNDTHPTMKDKKWPEI